MLTIPQDYVGLVNVVGDCHCFGLVQHLKVPTYKYVPVFVNVTGAASSVEALWAKLAQGKEACIIRDGDAPKLRLEPDDKGLYVRFRKKIGSLGVDHLLLVHREMAEPAYPTDGRPTQVYSFWLDETQGTAKLGEHVRKAVKVAVFDPWFGYLNAKGHAAGLVKALAGYGGVNAVQITLDPTGWTDLIAHGLQSGQIALSA